MSLMTKETQIVGGTNDFATVHHLVLHGTNQAIGTLLAEIARNRHGLRALPERSTEVIRARSHYFRQNYPIHLARMRGVATAFGVDPDDQRVDASMLPVNLTLPLGGCSSIYYPPTTTQEGHGILSRNYDFPTASLSQLVGHPGGSGESSHALMADAYVLELYPDQGYPSLALTAFDLLAGTLDGINSEGLTVALHMNPDASFRFTSPNWSGVGLYELQMARLLLDTCATVEEARLAFLLQKHYTALVPGQYLVADRFGHSFVWEFSPADQRDYLIDGEGSPQLLTNHPLSRYPDVSTFPTQGDGTAGAEALTFRRYRLLAARLAAPQQRYSLDEVKQTNACVFVDEALTGKNASPTPVRTLWHSIYDTALRSLQVSFYRSDEAGQTDEHPRRALRSPYFSFHLQER